MWAWLLPPYPINYAFTYSYRFKSKETEIQMKILPSVRKVMINLFIRNKERVDYKCGGFAAFLQTVLLSGLPALAAS